MAINKLIKAIICVLILSLSFTSVTAEQESGFVVQINIIEDGDKYIVDIVDDQFYAEEKPTVYVNNTLNLSNPYVINTTTSEGAVSSLDNGEISFTVEKGGVYKIYDVYPHKLVKHEASDATCLTQGNVEYWYCSHCDKYYLPNNVVSGTTSNLSNLITNELGHNFVGNECTRCHEVKVEINKVDSAAKSLIEKAVANITVASAQDGFDKTKIKEVKNKVETATTVSPQIKTPLVSAIDSKGIDFSKSPIEFFDLSVQIVDTGNKTANLTEIPGTGVLFEIPMSGELSVEPGYKYRVFRNHNGTVEEISGVVINASSISFRSNKLSTFAVVKVENPVVRSNSGYSAPKTCVE